MRTLLPKKKMKDENITRNFISFQTRKESVNEESRTWIKQGIIHLNRCPDGDNKRDPIRERENPSLYCPAKCYQSNQERKQRPLHRQVVQELHCLFQAGPSLLSLTHRRSESSHSSRFTSSATKKKKKKQQQKTRNSDAHGTMAKIATARGQGKQRIQAWESTGASSIRFWPQELILWRPRIAGRSQSE